jgi:hypothetical protein
MSDDFQRIAECTEGQFKICEAYLGIDFNTRLVSYSFTTTDKIENNTNNSSLIQADYLPYIETNITAIRFRQLTMKFSKANPHRFNINYCKFSFFHFDILIILI